MINTEPNFWTRRECRYSYIMENYNENIMDSVTCEKEESIKNFK